VTAPPGAVRFFFVDVFAERPLTGNPLTLVPDADDLTVEQMQSIAREFNQSETTFLLRPTKAGIDWRLRSFTPIGAEVDGAGHNALGAWLWLAASGQVGDQPSRVMRQQIGADVLDVEIVQEPGARTRIVMDQSPPRFGTALDDPEPLAAALGLRPDEIAQDRPAQVVSTGAAHLLVPLADRAAVDRAVPDSARLVAVLADAGGEGCYVFTTAAADPDDGAHAYARFFNPTMGIGEDPATGTAAGPLAATLTGSGRVGAGTPVIIEQGHRIGRPSRIQVDIDGERVRLSGGGLVVAEGRLTVP
jgi:trans-2,3-dihydro-3-hydroxyanthranilate isomerase